jgi:hypothetical protein
VRARYGAALLAAAAAFLLYHATLLPSFDFGDTGSFQATVGSPVIYPLYFAIGSAFVWLTGAEPAHALNLASAVEGAIASGVIVLAAAELSGSAVAGLAAALLFAGSYTFWSQAIIAEVYALHAIFVALSLLLLLRWNAHQTSARLALFFAVYALGFGNHLSMVLLLPGYTLFLLTSASGGWRSMFRPRIVALAGTLAALGALQYAWNIRELWLRPHPPDGIADALQSFWFDVTKSDWRDTMVARVPQSMIGSRLAMYAFDLRQQFGWPVPLLAVAGLARTWTRSRQRGALMLALYAINVLFAFTYNVGDAHVFYLPSHLILVLLASPGMVFAGELLWRFSRRPALRMAVGVLALAYAGARVYHDYPALDRSADNRPTELLSALTMGLDDQRAILLTDLNWQIQNGLSYFTKITRPEIVDARMPDVLLYAPALARDNHAIGREVALTERARGELSSAYGPLLPAVADAHVRVPTLVEFAAALPKGTRYVLSVLKPARDLPPDEVDLEVAARLLGAAIGATRADYLVMAGVVGSPPSLIVDSNRPFTRTVDLQGVPVEVRMEAWLDFDTIRRMGFGHVVAARRHTLIIERGISVAAFDENGRPIRTAYESNIYAPQPRYLLSWKP